MNWKLFYYCKPGADIGSRLPQADSQFSWNLSTLDCREERKAEWTKIPVPFQNVFTHYVEGVTSRYLLSFLKLQRFSYQLNSKNNASVLLFKTTFRHWICSLASVAADGKDGYGFKLDKVRPILSSFNDVTTKITKKLNTVSAPWWNLFLYNATGAFRVWVKALSNDFRTELTENSNIFQINSTMQKLCQRGFISQGTAEEVSLEW